MTDRKPGVMPRRPPPGLRPAGATLLLLVCLASPAAAQNGAGGGLDAVQVAIEAGRIDSARETLGRWFRAHGASDANGASRARETERVRARFLRARLSPDAAAAESDYRWVAVEGGDPWAPLARLRLAQLRLTRGAPAEALADLERLRADWAGGPLVAESWLWTGYAHEAAGDQRSACAAWRQAAAAAGSGASAPGGRVGVTAAAREALGNCGADGGETVRAWPQQPDGGETVPARTQPAGGRFSLQAGAFQSPASAISLRDQLARSGFEAHVREPDGGAGWYRVRTGRFATREAAEAAAERLADRGFPAYVVEDDG